MKKSNKQFWTEFYLDQTNDFAKYLLSFTVFHDSAVAIQAIDDKVTVTAAFEGKDYVFVYSLPRKELFLAEDLWAEQIAGYFGAHRMAVNPQLEYSI